MKKLAALSLLLAAAPAAAQEAAVSTAAAVQVSTAAVAAPLAPARVPPLRRLITDLNRLIADGGSAQPEKLDAIAAQAAALRAGVREALGKELLEAAELQEAPARAAAALETLAAFRKELRAWYAANGGKYPASPAELAPGRLPAVPELYLPGHEPSAAVTVIDSGKFDKDISKAVKDSGGWLYFAAPDSDNYGLLLIDCAHPNTAGQEFYKY